MKDKQFLRWMFMRAGIMLVVYFSVMTIMELTMDHTYTGKALNLTNSLRYFQDTDPFEIDKLEVHIDNPELVTLCSLEQAGDEVIWTFEPTMNGAGDVFVEIVNTENDRIMESTLLKVSKHGVILDMNTGNFSHYRVRQLCMVLLNIAIAVLLWAGFAKSVRRLRFSYQSVFCAGLGIWATLIAVLLFISYLQDEIMLNLYSQLSGAASRFAIYTFPIVLIFAILLSISNISLIRHEGFRMRNALGIVISFIMVGGFIFLLIFSNLISSGSEFQVDLWGAISETLETVYALLECFLFGAVICGAKAAKHQPAYDKDYIVILGCMIRKDGTLYPLIRGRVDRAIRFYREQLAATGKKAVFIPSGGKGEDEPVSEGEAMKRYLIEQGIEEQQILPETASVNTRQNMQFSMALMENDTKAVFSTTNYHVFRSGIIAGQVGFDSDGMGSPTKWYFWPNAYVREVIGMLSYKWQALVLVFIPIIAFLTVVRFTF